MPHAKTPRAVWPGAFSFYFLQQSAQVPPLHLPQHLPWVQPGQQPLASSAEALMAPAMEMPRTPNRAIFAIVFFK